MSNKTLIEENVILKAIEKLGYVHNYHTALDDFLSAFVNFFSLPDQEGFGTYQFEKYSVDERLLIGQTIHQAIHLFKQEIEKGKTWYDLFGDLYMELSSKSKSSALGQFFTPCEIVNMMVLMNADSQDLTGKGLRINDPACGSARLLIAFHSHFPGNYVFGEDLDLICCKMSIINMILHGCEGEVVWHDAIVREFRKAWRINPFLQLHGIPSVVEISREQCYLYKQERRVLLKESYQLKFSEPDILIPGTQLTLF